MMLETQTVRIARSLLAGLAIAAAHGAAIAWAIHEPPAPFDDALVGGAFVIELAEIAASPEEERRDVAVGLKSEEVAPVTASAPQQTAAVEPKPQDDEPRVPEATSPPPVDALVKPPEEKPIEEVKPQDTQVTQTQDAAAQAPVAASEAAAPQTIENAEKKSETPSGQTAGLSHIDRRVIANWQRDLVMHLNRHKRYPSRARQDRQHGIVSIAFTMDRGGRILGARIEKSSGHELLDTAAIAMLNKASPLPVPPDSMEGNAIDLVVPVNFRWRE